MDPLTTIPWREDWTIYRVKSALRLIGEFMMDVSNTQGMNSVLAELVDLPKGTHRVYVESKP